MTISAVSKAFAIESAGIDPAGRNAEVTTLSDGRYVVVWQEVLGTPADGFADSDGGIFARIYNADGSAAGDTLQINEWMPGLQDFPQVAATRDGGFVVSYQSTLNWGGAPADVDRFMATFDASGSQVARFYDDAIGNTYDLGDLDPDNPGAVDSGTFTVDLGKGMIAIVREAQINLATAVTLLDTAGDFLGTAASAEFAGFFKITGVAQLEGGNVVISGENQGGYAVLRLSNSTLDGAPDGIPGLVGPVNFITLSGVVDPVDVRVTALHPGTFAPETSSDLGGFIVSALLPNGLNASALKLQSFTAWGALNGSTTIAIPISLNGEPPGYDVLALADGSFVLAWTTKGLNGLDVMAGHFDADGAALGPSVVVQGTAVSGDQLDPSLSLMADGRVLVVFTDLGNHAIGGVTEPIHAVELTLAATSGGFPATAADDVLNGTGGHDGIDGLAGNDQINGLLGNDVLVGGLGNDSMTGGLGNDALIGGDGTDVLTGSAGNDGLAGQAGADQLRGEAGRDALSGGLQNDRLFGGTGADRLDGGAGNDVLTGGADADIFVFRHGGGTDTVTDFSAADFLRLDHGLWAASGDLTAGEVLTQFATVAGGNTTLTFAGGEVIVLQGFTALVAGELQLI